MMGASLLRRDWRWDEADLAATWSDRRHHRVRHRRQHGPSKVVRRLPRAHRHLHGRRLRGRRVERMPVPRA